MTKVCRACGVEKPLTEFWAQATCKQGRRPECKSCAAIERAPRYQAHRDRIVAGRRAKYHAQLAVSRAEARDRYQADKEYRSLVYRLNQHGLTLDQYHAMQERQDFSCAICGDELTTGRDGAHVDHHHGNGKVRALLCSGCNKGIGHFRERPDALAAAARYVAVS